MKKIIFFTLLFVVKITFGQSNLQYSSVKLISNTPETVPVGKIWKVESAVYNQEISSGFYGGGDDTRSSTILINGQIVSIRKSSIVGNPAQLSIIWEQHFPIWLPEGTTIKTQNNVLYLSVVEFNQQ
jgi:hypothetical protein